ncbi:MAG TPA: transcription antitermination factor NusB [Egibacteraceae bacterium]|nr:transcription antitermination factor NusB [Egibacteraceae bacterium]HVM15514.1 transcription antitermination factor NusB [Egibacteraceae bacterium]
MTASGRAHSRHAARKQALDVLYEADLKDRPVPMVLAEHLRGDESLADFAVALVRGVHRHRDTLDPLIEAHARDWTLSRMPVVDRNLLRMGLYEILHDDDVPSAVAIDEAVELAKELSTDNSGRFINGVLARIADAHATDPPA